MARRTEGQRIQPASAFALKQQARGETSALASLREYRAQGGTIRTQDWYRIWRGGRDLPPPPEPPKRKAPPIPGRRPRDWITHLGVVYLDPRNGSYVTHWQNVHSSDHGGGRRRISDEEAMQAAIDMGDPTAERYEWTAVLVYVTSYEPVY